jgi:hypothetical protein
MRVKRIFNKKITLILSQTKVQLQLLKNTCVNYSQTTAWFLASGKRYVLLTNIKYYMRRN